MTIKEALSEGRAVLRSALAIHRQSNRHEVLGAALEAEVLLAFALNKPREYFITHPQDEIPKKNLDHYTKQIRERRCGVPVAHLIGHKEFFKLDFFVNRHVLIPRPETELLVEEVIRITREYERGSIVDVGTGSGCIAVSIAKHLPKAQICAVDRSSSALKVAKKNAKHHGVDSRIDFVKSDLLAAVGSRAFDGIVANLPYIGTRENNLVEKQVLEHEPKMALFGGETGLELFERMFRQIRRMPVRPKWLVAEMGFLQKPAISSLLQKHFGEARVLWKNDLGGLPRMLIIHF